MVVVFVSGCFDLLHSGHVAFFEQASSYGDLYVSIGSDENVKLLKHHETMFPNEERKFMVESIRYVKRANICKGFGMLDFEHDLDLVKPDIFFVNADGDRESKRLACEKRNIKYVVAERIPKKGLEPRSSTSIKTALAKTLHTTPESAPSGTANGTSGMKQSETEVENPRLATRKPRERPVVMVSGCYDLLHSGHVAFFKEAAELGDLYVSIGNDANIEQLKHHKTMFPEQERLYMVSSIKYVSEARICKGFGMLDFEADMDILHPEIFFVNADGHRESKREACEKRGIRYVVSDRKPMPGLSARSSTSIKAALEEQERQHRFLHAFPWRICLCGGWLDQPWVSEKCAGPVIVVNIHPHEQFKSRSGLATSTRGVGIKLWYTMGDEKTGENAGRPPRNCPDEEIANMLFGAENPPGVKYVSGSQDALGLMLPGISKLNYDGEYWPRSVERIQDEKITSWLESVLWLVPLPSRPNGYDPLLEKNLDPKVIQSLSSASQQAWDAILNCDATKLGDALKKTMQAWRSMLPYTVPMPQTKEWVAPYEETTHGYLFSGAGGGFLLVISEKPVENGFKVKINTTRFWKD